MLIDTQSYDLREAAILTTSEVFHELSTQRKALQTSNQLTLLIDFTKGSLTNVEIKIYTSNDGEDWYAVPVLGYSSGVGTANDLVLTLTTDMKFSFEVPINTKYLRVGAKGTGTVTGSSLSLIANLGSKS